MIICGHDFTLYVDYDRGNFGRLDLSGKVTYMHARVERDLIQPCRLAVKVSDRVAVGLLVPGLICSGISAASTFLHGRRAQRPGEDARFFKTFVRDYMHQELVQQLACPDRRVKNYIDWLYHNVRCGLSHSFALEWGHIEGPNLGAYVALSAATQQPSINQNEFVEDFARGWTRYLGQVAAAPNDQTAVKFQQRFDAVFHD
jgi:hypothetical protein